MGYVLLPPIVDGLAKPHQLCKCEQNITNQIQLINSSRA